MLICCSSNIYSYFQGWKLLCCLIFLCGNRDALFSGFFSWIENSKEQHLFEIEILCNIINVYCHFWINQLNASLLNKNNLLKKQTYSFECDVFDNVTHINS